MVRSPTCRQATFAATLTFAFLLAGCTGPGDRTDDTDEELLSRPVMLPLERLDAGTYPDGDPSHAQAAIMNQDDWETFWQEHREQRRSANGTTDDESPPEIDFSERFVAFAYAGRHTDTRVTIEMTAATWMNGVYTVHSTLHVPGEGCNRAPGVTHPYGLAAIERIDAEPATPRGSDGPLVNVDILREPYTC